MEHEKQLAGSVLNEVHPWRRYFARAIDIALFSGLLLLFRINIPPIRIAETIDIGFFLEFPMYLIVDILMLTYFGTTVGKFILGIQLSDRTGSKLTFHQVLKREVMVWFYGYGLNIPIVSLITMLRSVNDLEGKGITKWDEKLGLVVSHKKLTWVRILTCILILGVAPTFMIWMHKI